MGDWHSQMSVTSEVGTRHAAVGEGTDKEATTLHASRTGAGGNATWWFLDEDKKPCSKWTGGTCKYLKCHESRNAECILDLCQCVGHFCAVRGGRCTYDGVSVAVRAR